MYSTDVEYRQYFRKITEMREQVFHREPDHVDLNEGIPEDMDETTLDEYMYDEDAVTKTFDRIYQVTKDNVQFQELYDLAAAQMISMDREIGLAILMTYDYLWLFNACVVEYSEHREFDAQFNQLVGLLKPDRG
jgi:hypothetical protein